MRFICFIFVFNRLCKGRVDFYPSFFRNRCKWRLAQKTGLGIVWVGDGAGAHLGGRLLRTGGRTRVVDLLEHLHAVGPDAVHQLVAQHGVAGGVAIGVVDRLEVVGVDQQRDALVAFRQSTHSSFQFRVSPPRSGLSCASPKGTASGRVQGSRLSVTVPVLRGRP